MLTYTEQVLVVLIAWAVAQISFGAVWAQGGGQGCEIKRVWEHVQDPNGCVFQRETA